MAEQQMFKEWDAWKAMCRVLRIAGVEINDNDELATAIKTWGDELVTLRQAQAAKLKETMISAARRAERDNQYGR